MALIVDDPTYDAGQNEGIVARLAKPTRVSGDDGQVVGIEIVYGDVSKAIVQAEANDRPLLVYSWVPRAEIMKTKNKTDRFVRITLESFYHCGPGESSSPLTLDQQRGVTACDYAVEHVEKAVVWRLQQPSSTKAAVFVHAFNLNATQLLELLEIGGDLNLTRNSTPSAAQLDEAACVWLNKNTETWEAWLPGFELYNTLLYQWNWWLGICGAVILVGGIIILDVVRRSKEKEEKAEDGAEQAVYSSWPDKQADEQADKQADKNRMISCLSFMCCCKMINSKKWEPVLKYLNDALRCMVNADPPKTNPWSFRSRLVCFALGQLFVAASTGFIEGLIYSSWLTNGLNELSLEVTISCAILMVTLEVVKSYLRRLPSGKQIVRRQLQIRLRIKYKELKPILNPETRLYCEEQFEEAVKSTASELASGCYIAAFEVLADFLGFLSAVVFLFYYMFNEGIPQDVSYLMIGVFICAPVWLVTVLLIGPLASRRRFATKAKVMDGGGVDGGGGRVEVDVRRSFDVDAAVAAVVANRLSNRLMSTAYGLMSTTDNKKAYGGILWTCVYFMWAYGPILINPLKNDLGPGTNSIPLSDLLTASKRRVVHI
eukprot:scaffold25934_cov56-Phaeocystis_antarctica.AAC.2